MAMTTGLFALAAAAASGQVISSISRVVATATSFLTVDCRAIHTHRIERRAPLDFRKPILDST
jgi:hypothetical protein